MAQRFMLSLLARWAGARAARSREPGRVRAAPLRLENGFTDSTPERRRSPKAIPKGNVTRRSARRRGSSEIAAPSSLLPQKNATVGAVSEAGRRRHAQAFTAGPAGSEKLPP